MRAIGIVATIVFAAFRPKFPCLVGAGQQGYHLPQENRSSLNR